eukprot:TRINITY_DN1469_c0_g1_i1.p1 TRINITY_DN1469_c0_g1~~TRINITY_DN1469_c0_g1_i1.p1  ORF type:complete len:153 (+),score=16.79 TRINITY_DN1469_c0_g1_i1:156-614(+)
MGDLFSRMLASFFTKRLEVVLVGLESSGKTTLCNQLALGDAGETSPTVGLNVRVLSRNRVTFKVWDIGGQQKYRSEWPRYTQGCDVILFVVDSNDVSALLKLFYLFGFNKCISGRSISGSQTRAAPIAGVQRGNWNSRADSCKQNRFRSKAV